MFGTINLPAYAYSPNDMLSDFKNIKFTVDGERMSIAVNAYRNNNAAMFASAEKGGTQDALSVKDALMSLDRGIVGKAGGASNYVSVFVGKGSPASIATVLGLFYEYSDPFIARFGKSVGPRRKCADWLADPNLSWQQTLQNISTAFVGLDCNGFVGNWIRASDSALRLEPNTPPRSFFDRRKTQRTKLEDIQFGDVVVWANGSHIAAIDEEAGGVGKFHICQSAGGGPRRNEYSIRVSSPGKFRLSGGYPAGDVAGEVHIFSLWN